MADNVFAPNPTLSDPTRISGETTYQNDTGHYVQAWCMVVDYGVSVQGYVYYGATDEIFHIYPGSVNYVSESELQVLGTPNQDIFARSAATMQRGQGVVTVKKLPDGTYTQEASFTPTGGAQEIVTGPVPFNGSFALPHGPAAA